MAWPVFSRGEVRGPELLIQAGRSSKRPSHSWGTSGRDLGRFGVLMLVHGAGHYRDGDGRFEAVTAGHCFMLFPGLRHDYGPGAGDRWEEAYVDFDGGLARLLQVQGVLDRRRVVFRPDDSAWRQMLGLVSGIESGQLVDPRECQWRLHSALLALVPPSEDEDALEAGRRMLASEPERPMDMRRPAQAAGMGWELFRKRFRLRYGVPPARYRLHARCNTAAQRLLDPRMTIDAVAEASGFCDGAHLRRHFRKVFAVSPDAFRRLHRSA